MKENTLGGSEYSKDFDKDFDHKKALGEQFKGMVKTASKKKEKQAGNLFSSLPNEYKKDMARTEDLPQRLQYSKLQSKDNKTQESHTDKNDLEKISIGKTTCENNVKTKKVRGGYLRNLMNNSDRF